MHIGFVRSSSPTNPSSVYYRKAQAGGKLAIDAAFAGASVDKRW